jgi:ATP-binding cassette, subfamily B, bacterial
MTTLGRGLRAACGLAARTAPVALVGYGLLALAGGAVGVVTAWLTKVVLDGLVGGAAVSTLVWLGGGVAVAGIAAGVVPQLTQYVRGQLERETTALAQDRLFAAVERFVGLGRFEDPAFLDRLRLARQAARSTVQRAVDGLVGVLRSLVTVVGFVGSLAVISPLMTGVVLASGVPVLVSEILMSRRRAAMLWKIEPAQRLEFFYGELLSSVDAAKEVRLFGIGPFLRTRMLTELRKANAAKRAVDRREVVVQAGLALLAGLVAGGGLLFAVIAARAGTLSIGDIAVFTAATVGVQGALAALASETAGTHEALLMFEHYLMVTAAGPDLPVSARPRPVPPLRYGIELRDVWFRYSPTHPWVLRGVTLRIPRGASVALVGLNGAGKSTLVKLLCRFYDPVHGTIRWDGVDLRDVDPVALRRRIGAVFQDFMHYDLTAAENIGLGDLPAMDDRPRLTAAARKAGIHDTIRALPRGYDTLLSRAFVLESEVDDPESGVVLSGGQQQRLAMARSFLRDHSELMILDEPASGLDAEAEHQLHASLRRYRAGRTSLLISHRLGAIRDADLIVVLADGRIVEWGNHASLMAGRGGYARLFTVQAAGYRGERERTRT